MQLPFFPALDAVRLMIALTDLALVVLVWLTIEKILTYGWPDHFQLRYSRPAWRRLYAISAATFGLALGSVWWLALAPRMGGQPLWLLVGALGIVCAMGGLWLLGGLIRGLEPTPATPAYGSSAHR
jgi:hypothetical protein